MNPASRRKRVPIIARATLRPRQATKIAILDAAERLFADGSFSSVSLRDITTAAAVNLAAVNYHFGSKELLVRELFKLRSIELNRERARLLHDAETAGPGAPQLEQVLYALIAPPVRGWLSSDPARSCTARFLVRAIVEATPEVRRLIETEVGHLQRFVVSLARAMPQLSHAEICLRLHFTLGVMHYAINDRKRLEMLSLGACDYSDPEGVIGWIVGFAAAGFAASGAIADRG
jgi:AcrR family transcriptional regulator